MSALLLHPKQTELSAERAAKHAELVDLLFRLEHMRLQTKPYLRALYRQHFGLLELQLMQAKRQTMQLRADCSSNGAARVKLSVVANTDSGSVPRNPTQRYLRAQARHSQRLKTAAQYFAASSASAAESEELRQLFKNVLRVIHPTLVAEADQALFAEPWLAAQRAYHAADLAQLEDIAGQIVHHRIRRKRRVAAATLRAEIKQLDKKLARYQQQYQRLNQLRVFKQAKRLLDPAWRQQHRGFLERGIAQQRQTQKIYQQLIAQRAQRKRGLRRGGKPQKTATVADLRSRYVASAMAQPKRHATIASPAAVARGRSSLPLQIPLHHVPAR